MKKLLSILLFTTLVFSLIPITASAKNEQSIQTDSQSVYQSREAAESVTYFSLVISEYENRYLPNESIELFFSVTPFAKIVDFNYQSTGFNEIDASIDASNENAKVPKVIFFILLTPLYFYENQRLNNLAISLYVASTISAINKKNPNLKMYSLACSLISRRKTISIK